MYKIIQYANATNNHHSVYLKEFTSVVNIFSSSRNATNSSSEELFIKASAAKNIENIKVKIFIPTLSKSFDRS